MLPRVHRVRRGGKLYLYHRVTKARLPDLAEDHPDFLSAWLAEERAGAPPPPKAAPRPGTIAKAVDDYLSSGDLDGTSEGYADAIRRHLLAIQGAGHAAMLSGLIERHVSIDVGKFSGHVARARLKAWRRFLAWAKRTGRIASDPSKGVERPPVPRSEGNAPWTAEDVAAFRARWPIGTVARALFEVLHWTGARVGDAGRLTRGMVRDGLLTYKQGKTGHEAHVPWEGPVQPFVRPTLADRDLMHQALAAMPAKGLLILPKSAGRGEGARTAGGLGNEMAKAARSAGLIDRSAHGLRKTRLIAIAEAGGTTHQLAAWGGHQSLKEIEHYTEAANRRKALAAPQRVKARKPAGKTVERTVESKEKSGLK